jgi:hypothetical protein
MGCKFQLAVVVSCLLLSACSLPVKASFAPARSSFVPSSVTDAQEVEIYRSTMPSGPYEEIGTVHVPSTDLAVAAREMKIAAAKNGGNAVVEIKVTAAGTTGTVVRFTSTQKDAIPLRLSPLHSPDN